MSGFSKMSAIGILVVSAVAVLGLWAVVALRGAARARFRRSALAAVHRFQVRLARYQLASRRIIRAELVADGAVQEAMAAHAAAHGLSDTDVRVRVERYVDEIVPFFNVLSYYRIGYNVARVVLNALYRVSSAYQDRAALEAIPKDDVVVYVMNHRSNADYVVVAYLLARGVSISYAVGEWARTWPLEYVFKSFGSYFVRRGFREPLYHTVLERYVQRVTMNGVTQGIFVEGGLSRDGGFRPAKIGLLDYVARTVRDPSFTRDIWFVPVALNYDRVLEDRVLVAESTGRRRRTHRLSQLVRVTTYVGGNLGRLMTGRLKRYGRVAVNFGTPLSLRAWCRADPGVLERPKEERLPHIQMLADELLRRIGTVMPVTSVPLVSVALLSFGESVVTRTALLERIERLRDDLARRDAKVVHVDAAPSAILDRAWRTLGMRRLVHREGEAYVILPSQRPVIAFYANSIRHWVDWEAHRTGERREMGRIAGMRDVVADDWPPLR